jgi:hypothetical protein
VQATSSKFGLHTGKWKFHPQNEEWVSTCIFLMVYLSINKKYTYNNRKTVFKKCNSQPRLHTASLFLAHFYILN